VYECGGQGRKVSTRLCVRLHKSHTHRHTHTLSPSQTHTYTHIHAHTLTLFPLLFLSAILSVPSMPLLVYSHYALPLPRLSPALRRLLSRTTHALAAQGHVVDKEWVAHNARDSRRHTHRHTQVAHPRLSANFWLLSQTEGIAS
jgi:hypothetical protein